MRTKLYGSEKTFHYIALGIMIFLMVYCFIPFILMVSVSLTGEDAIAMYGYRFWPTSFSSSAYQFLAMKWRTIGRCYLLTIFVTTVGTCTNLILTSMFAYPLSRHDFGPRYVFAFIIFFTVMFNGGLTASYIMWTRVFHIKNTVWAYILPGGLMGAMNVLMVRNYYNASIPYSIIEAARIDGASEFTVYTRIMIPLSKPVLATIGLFAAVGFWNNWTTGLYYISESNLYTIQVYLQKLMNNIQFLKSSTDLAEAQMLALQDMPTEAARMAIAIVAIIPILCIYPFIQKQLIKGLVVGGVKG